MSRRRRRGEEEQGSAQEGQRQLRGHPLGALEAMGHPVKSVQQYYRPPQCMRGPPVHPAITMTPSFPLPFLSPFDS